jgi:hypothetical protein
VARADLTQGNNANNAAAYSTASIMPAAERVTLAFVMNVRAGLGQQQAAEPSAQGNGMTWTRVESVQVAGAANRRLTCFRATGTPSPGPVSFSFGGEQQALCAWSLFEYDGVTEAKSRPRAVVARCLPSRSMPWPMPTRASWSAVSS